MSKIVGGLGGLIVVCFLVLWTSMGQSQEISKDPVEKILSGDARLIEEGEKEITSNRSQQIKRLLDIVKDTALRTKNRPAVVAAIELLGELRADESAPELAQMLLFGNAKDIHDQEDIHGKLYSPDKAAPAVAALINIGIASLKPVTEQLVAITEETKDKDSLCRHCFWVIKGVLGPQLGKAYLTQLCEKDERAAKSKFVKGGFHFMDVHMYEEREPDESKRSERNEPKQEKNKDPVEKILSGDTRLTEEGKKEILSNRSQQIKRLLDIVKDTALRTKNRPAVVAAIEVLGELRAEESAPELAQMLLFGDEKDISDDKGEDPKKQPPPDKSSPAVAALIRIGIPSLKPVTEQLLAITEETKYKDTLSLHCLWVIKGVLRPQLGKVYLTQLCERDERAVKSEFVKDGFHFMDVHMGEENKREESNQSERNEPKQEKSKDPVEKILSGDARLIEEGEKEILSNRSEQIKRLLDIVKDTALRTKNRPAVVAAIELLGELRAAETAPELAQMLLFGNKKDIHDQRKMKEPLPPDETSPAVAALIKIGIPSLKPVTEQLLAITKETKDKYSLSLHCLWVIKGILKPQIGKAYLTQLCGKDERAAKSEFVKDGFNFMDAFMFEEKKPEESKQSERSEPEQEKTAPKPVERQETAKEEPNWLLPGLIIIGVVIAGVVIFSLLRRRKA